MKSSNYLIIFVHAVLYSRVHGADRIYSNDTISLKLSDNTKTISGSPGSRVNLEFILKNHGPPGSFKILQLPGDLSGLLNMQRVQLFSDEMVTIKVQDILLPSNRGEFLLYTLQAQRESGIKEGRSDVNGGYNSGGFNNQGRPDINGGFNSGGSNNGGFNIGGNSNGGFDNQGRPDINGGYNSGVNQNGGFNNGGFNNQGRPDINGGYNSGGNQNGGFNNGGFDNQGRPDINGGFNSGGNQNGGFNNGGLDNQGRPDINGGFNSGGNQNGGFNNGGFNNQGRPDINGGFNSGGIPNGGFNSGDNVNGGFNNQGRPDINGGYNSGFHSSGEWQVDSSRPDYLQPGYKSSVETTVRFHVHSQYVSSDTQMPTISRERVDADCRVQHSCSDHTWRLRFRVQDAQSGLFRITLKDNNNLSPFWWRDNHHVGGTDSVLVEALISCCSTGLTLEVEDVNNNLLVAYEDVGQAAKPKNWALIIGISVGVGAVVLIALVGLGACIYRRRYSAVSQSE